MKIKEIEIKNFKSYGNNIQKLKFSDKGELILCSGKNGNGKSSIRDVLDFCLYSKVSGRTKKLVGLGKLPNRDNKNLYTSINFTNFKNQEIIIQKWVEPNKLKIVVDGEDYTDKYKILSIDQKEQLIGITYSMYKTFISLCMKDFENFIQLTESGKNDLLNKLFQLEDLFTYLSICKEYTKQVQFNIEFINNKMISLRDDITRSKKFLESINTNEKNEITSLKEQINYHKPRFCELDNLIKENNTKYSELLIKIKSASVIKNEQEQEISKNKNKLEHIQESLEVYESGKCPTCNTNLTDGEHVEHKNQLIDSSSKLKSKITEMEETLNSMIIEETRIINGKETLYNTIQCLKEEFSNLKGILIELKAEYSAARKQEQKVNIDEIKSNYEKSKEEYNLLLEKKQELCHKESIYSQLCKILAGTDIKKNLILKIIEPVNKYLQDFLTKMDCKFRVKLNEEFDARITQREEIDPEIISKGEAMKINLSIALSYLCSILDLKHCNIIFLDEIFDGLDMDTVDLTLNILKEISEKYGITIITVHHAIINTDKFDRIWKITKQPYSMIEDLRIK